MPEEIIRRKRRLSSFQIIILGFAAVSYTHLGTPVLIFGQNKWYQPGSADSPATKNPLRGTTAGK